MSVEIVTPIFFVFLFGLCAGSFLNVCIYRLPREESLISPGSHCTECQRPVFWYHNIPLIGYLWLRGRCSHCGKKIAFRYFFIELASGILWVLLWLILGFSWHFAAGVCFVSILMTVSIIDLETGLIPDEMTFAGMGLGLFFSILSPSLMGQSLWYWGLRDSFLGLLAGGALLWLTGIIGDFIFRKESMGGGDIKLLAMIGCFVGAGKVVIAFFLAPLLALPIALYAKYVHKAETIPFGPYIALGGLILFFWGDFLRALFYYA